MHNSVELRDFLKTMTKNHFDASLLSQKYQILGGIDDSLCTKLARDTVMIFPKNVERTE